MSLFADVADTDDEPGTGDDSRPLRDLRGIAGGACADCSARFSAYEAVWCIALGFRDAPRCLGCLAGRLGRDPGDLAAQVTDYVLRRGCYRAAWQEAARLDGGPPPAVSEAVTPGPGRVGPVADAPPPAADWDAGDTACGELVLALRGRLTALPPGAVLRVRAVDPAAPEDIPAWCRLTGHTLVAAGHPFYSVRRKGD